MAMLLSRARLGLRLARPARSSEMLSAYSESGSFSTFSFRMRYTILLKKWNDPAVADFMYEKWLHAWVADAPSYNYWFVCSLAMGLMFGFLSRQWFFNPDIYGRSQEMRKPLPDRHRQWTYCLPYYNHRLRNMSCKYKWCMIDNEPDWGDFHPLGYRPNRSQIHRRPWMWCFSINRYLCEDPLYTSCTHDNMTRMYQEIGYEKKKPWEIVEED
ncbi:unnamed protein product [Prorocentrum cordatum]|uniref:Uncharacterized protein n=1 Tax=Prorocentrum cordatum TaxID=2364126 RepID=A0ABN9XWX7_9DINO|nr:unnamed protein product [Polarella glacialis]